MLALGTWPFSHIIYKSNNMSQSLLATAGTTRTSGILASMYLIKSNGQGQEDVCLLFPSSEASDCSFTFPFLFSFSTPLSDLAKTDLLVTKNVGLEYVDRYIQIHHCWRHLYG